MAKVPDSKAWAYSVLSHRGTFYSPLKSALKIRSDFKIGLFRLKIRFEENKVLISIVTRNIIGHGSITRKVPR